jgi:transposase-like protein
MPQQRFYKELDDEAYLRHQHFDLGRSLSEIAREIGCQRTPVAQAFARHGIVPNIGRSGPPRRVDAPPEKLIEDYRRLGSLALLAKEYEVSEATVRNMFANAGLRASDHTPERPYPQLRDREWLENAVYHHTSREITEMIGCPHLSMLAALRKFGLTAAPFTPPAVVDQAVKMYREGIPMYEVAQVFGRDIPTISRWVNKRWRSDSERSRMAATVPGRTSGSARPGGPTSTLDNESTTA